MKPSANFYRALVTTLTGADPNLPHGAIRPVHAATQRAALVRSGTAAA